MLPFHYRPSNRPPYSLFKKGRQCKPRNNLNIILSVNSFYCRKSNYCIRWVVCLDKISTHKKVHIRQKPATNGSCVSSQPSEDWHLSTSFHTIRHTNVTSKVVRKIYILHKSNNQQKGVQNVSIFHFAHRGPSGRDRSMQSVPITTKVVSFNPADGEMYSIQH